MQLLQLTSYKAICSLLTHAVETHVERLEELALRRVRSHPHLDQQAVQAALLAPPSFKPERRAARRELLLEVLELHEVKGQVATRPHGGPLEGGVIEVEVAQRITAARGATPTNTPAKSRLWFEV